jgi:hypothetical protein
MRERAKPTGLHSHRRAHDLERERAERKAKFAASRLEAIARAERSRDDATPSQSHEDTTASDVSTGASAMGLIAVGIIMILLALSLNSGRSSDAPGSGSTSPASSSHVEGPTADDGARCDGTNGNDAVAACHPDDPAVLAACQSNDYDSDGFATPSTDCLAAARDASP